MKKHKALSPPSFGRWVIAGISQAREDKGGWGHNAKGKKNPPSNEGET